MTGQDYNTAGRLADLLRPLLGVGKQNTTSAADYWSNAFGFSWPNDRGQVLRAAGQVIIDADNVKDRILRLDGVVPAELALRHYDGVLKTVAEFSLLPARNLSQFSAHISEAAILALDTCAHFLSQHDPEPALTEGERDAVNERLLDLREAIRDADFGVELQDWLDGRLDDIAYAVTHYARVGGRALRAVHDQLVGELVTRPSYMAELRSSPAGEKLGLLIATMALALQVWTGVVSPALESGPPASSVEVTVIQQLGVAPEHLQWAEKMAEEGAGSTKTAPSED